MLTTVSPDVAHEWMSHPSVMLITVILTPKQRVNFNISSMCRMGPSTAVHVTHMNE